MIFAGVNGYLDKLQVSQVGDFEEGLLAYLRGEASSVLDAIRQEKQITDEIKENLTAAIDQFAKSFAG